MIRKIIPGKNRRKQPRTVHCTETDENGKAQLNHVDNRNIVERAISIFKEFLLFLIFFVFPLIVSFVGAAELAEHGLSREGLTVLFISILFVFSYWIAKRLGLIKPDTETVGEPTVE